MSTRTHFVAAVVSYLNTVYKLLGDAPYPTTSFIDQLAREVDVPRDSMRTWFTRKRSADRRALRKRRGTAPAPQRRATMRAGSSNAVVVPRYSGIGTILGEIRTELVPRRPKRQRGRRAVETLVAEPKPKLVPSPTPPPAASPEPEGAASAPSTPPHAWTAPTDEHISSNRDCDPFTVPDTVAESLDPHAHGAHFPQRVVGDPTGLWLSPWVLA